MTVYDSDMQQMKREYDLNLEKKKNDSWMHVQNFSIPSFISPSRFLAPPPPQYLPARVVQVPRAPGP